MGLFASIGRDGAASGKELEFLKHVTDLQSARLERPILECAFWILVLLSIVGIWQSEEHGLRWLAILFALALFTFLYGGFVEPHLLTVKQFRIPLVKEPHEWIRFVFLSDLHAGGHKHPTFYRRMVERAKTLDADIVILGGDAVEERVAYIDQLKPLSNLRGKLGQFFILGNHDYLDDPQAVRTTLQAWGYQDLTNHGLDISKGGRVLEIFGLDDSWFGTPELELLKDKKTKPRLAVVHEPDALQDFEGGEADVILMGHTHGGQVRLPFIGHIKKLPQKVPQWLDRGWKEWKGIPVIISQGLGEADSRARLFCPPQIVVLEVGI